MKMIPITIRETITTPQEIRVITRTIEIDLDALKDALVEELRLGKYDHLDRLLQVLR